jgi:membrane associated rhomboid family serine protease
MDENSADKSEYLETIPVDPRDGLINFASYSLEQLRELKGSIDSRAFPKNFSNLLSVLHEKETNVAEASIPHQGFQGLFTSHRGILGWLKAKSVRSPVYGSGSLEVRSPELIIWGSQRTWLGLPIEAELARPLSSIRNVVREGTAILFEIKRPYRLTERIRFVLQDPKHAEELMGELPATKTSGFQGRWEATRALKQKLDAVSGTPLITPIIVAVNVMVFVAMAFLLKHLGQFSVQELIGFGANYGPLTTNGQWWRLFTATVVHFNLLHLLLNMWALWNIGCLTERLYGRGTYVFLYIAAGMLASLASIAWDPSLSSVGASGAIFGIFGAFLAFFVRQPQQIPVSIARKYWISTAVFVLFNLFDGAVQPGIDNAAHVGGLASGFFLGMLLARPLDRKFRERPPIGQTSAALVCTTVLVLLALWQVKGIGSQLTVPERYFRSHQAYASGAEKNLKLWNELAVRIGAGTISDAEFEQRLEAEILPFWRQQKDILKSENESAKNPSDFAMLVAQFADLRYQWATALIDAVQKRELASSPDALRLMNATNAVQVKLERLTIRSRMDHRMRGLAAASWVNRLRQFASGGERLCVTSHDVRDTPLGDADNKSDGPAMRYELACRAQQWFLNGDYQRLDSLMRESSTNAGDLPDGGSRYEALVSGLSTLFSNGPQSIDTFFQHTADWRRSVKDPTIADLVEAQLFSAWAWAARGGGYANAVNAQNMMLYSYRTQMAAAALDELAKRAIENPFWYTLSLDVGLDQGTDREQLHGIFIQGRANAPDYLPLYRRMLRILMPRWRGSYAEVDRFINEIQTQTEASRGYEWYARLYSSYARMEGDEVDLFHDTPAIWSEMRSGYLDLVKRYPTSDSVLNNFANFACRAQDKNEYKRLRGAVGKRFSATAWTTKYSLDLCDQQMGTSSRTALDVDIASGRIQSLGGIHIGMSRKDLLAAKGHPDLQEASYWVYGAIDSKHCGGGFLTVAFSASQGSPEGKAVAVAYNGDQACAPAELPYLNGSSSVEILQDYGPQITGEMTLHAPMSFTFRNGLYVNVRDEHVYSYGIYLVPERFRKD